MLDLHVLYLSGGNVNLTSVNTIPASDGQVVAGVPLLTSPRVATLAAWGGVGITAADAIKEAKLTSNDLNDPVNGSDFKISGTAIDIMTPHLFEQLPYQTAARQISLAQKAAGNEFSFLIDHYSPQEARALGVFKGSRTPAMRNIYSQLFGGAVTANVWSTQTFTPPQNLPAGKYAILGAWVTNITNVMALRFQHSDFGMCQPGFIIPDSCVVSQYPGALANDEMQFYQGIQFVHIGEMLGVPECPVFRAGPNGTGLTIWAFDLTADTPTVILNLVFLGS